MITPHLLNTYEAARMLGLSCSTLEKWRFYKTPDTPPFVKIGRAVRYPHAGLTAWVQQRSPIA